VTGSVLGYHAASGMLLAWTGGDLVGLLMPSGPIACILDSADLQPVTSIAPGELLSIFGESLSFGVIIPAPGQYPTSLGGVSVQTDGIQSPLLYFSPRQINFQTPFEIAGAAQANIAFASTQQNLASSLTLGGCREQPGGVSQYGADELRRGTAASRSQFRWLN
jgi:hypothetical protein